MTAEQTAAPPETSAPASPTAAAVFVLVLICAANAFNYVDRSALALVLPQVKAELRMSDTMLGLAVGLPFSLCYALFAIPAGWLADHWRRAPLLGVSLAVWSLFTGATGWVQSGLQLAVARLGLGAAEAPGLPTSAAMIAERFSRRWQALAFGALGSSAYVGLLVGFPIVGVIARDQGWRAAFMAISAAGLVLAVAFLVLVRDLAPASRSGAAAGRGQGARQELAALLGNRSYVLVTTAGALSAINLASMFGWGPTFLSRVWGLDPQQIGVYFGSLRGVAGLIGALSAGALMSVLIRRNPAWQTRAPAIMAFLLFGTDAVFLLAPQWGWKLGLFGSAFLAAAIVAASYPLYVGVVSTRTRALATAVYLLMATLVGQTLGPLIVGALNDSLASIYGGHAVRFTMLAVSSTTCLSGIAILLAGKTWRRDSERAGGG